MKYILQICLILSCSLKLSAQDTIRLLNPSFEDQPHRGSAQFPTIRLWTDCGALRFPAESPPDIHPGDFWEVSRPASHENTYLGMVVRETDTYEGVAQRLFSPLKAGNCYEISLDLASSDTYLSKIEQNEPAKSFTTAVVLRIYGGTGLCKETQLLAESDPISHQDWRRYTFKLEPKREYRYFMIEAFYKTPTLFAYNGNILVDHISPIVQVACDEEELLTDTEEIIETVKEEDSKPQAEEKPTTETVEKIPEPEPEDEVIAAEISKPKILKALDSRTIKKGQTIKVEKLFFEQDSFHFNDDSYEVLDEIYSFLKNNPKVAVEIGGHTNGLPSNEYCDMLSTKRAKSVALYLIDQGIPSERLRYKGYGKRQPIASNRTRAGRARNQRVEIKILSVGG